MARVWVEEKQRYFEIYDQSWNAFYDLEKKKWLRVPPDDPRGTHLLSVKGVAVDTNYPIDDYPEAPALTAEKRREIKAAAEAAHARTWIDTRAPGMRD